MVHEIHWEISIPGGLLKKISASKFSSEWFWFRLGSFQKSPKQMSDVLMTPADDDFL